MKKLFGVTTAMTTPFTSDDRIDVEALKQQTEFLIEKGVHCLYPTGTTGEMILCTPEERELIAETVISKAAGRVVVYVHVGALTQKDTIRLAQHAVKAGADGIGVVTPIYFTLDDRMMVQYYEEVCASVPENFPVYAYAIPQLAHNDLSPEVLEIIAQECKNLIGIKYSYPDMTRLQKYLRINGGDFSVLFGADHLFLPALSAGADGIVSGCSGPFPEIFVKVYDLFVQGDIEAARKAQDIATDLVWKMKSGADISIFKSILTMRGVRGGHMRKPLLDLEEKLLQMLQSEVAQYL